MEEIFRENSKRIYSHIYIEEKAFEYSATAEIISKINYAKIVKIKRYKDVFSKENQNVLLEKKYPNLILAVNENKFLYEGSENCQSFGLDKYFYLLSAMNCPFDCDYCFLKGMYPSANIVYFVNYEDAFKEIDEKIGNQRALVNLSYETDLFAIDNIVNNVEKWNNISNNRQNIQFEIRTKAAPDLSKYGKLNLILAFTLSPDEIIERFEHNTPILERRIAFINSAIKNGNKVRLCFDPLIHTKNYQEIYERFFQKIIKEIDFSKIFDVSIGTFRMPIDYLKNMKKRYGENEISLYPYERMGKDVCYSNSVENSLISIARENLEKVLSTEKIYEIK